MTYIVRIARGRRRINMVSKEDQMKFGIWNNMKEHGFTVSEIALFTGFVLEEVEEFFNR